MILAGMIHEDETALICDLAETYGILDWRALPLKTAAALSSGLRENSRIKMKIAGVQADQETLLLAAAVDRLSLLVWAKTKDGMNGRNKPDSIYEQMIRRPEEEKKDETIAFDNAEAFRAAWQKAVSTIKEV
jgi:hypothetical protein